MKKNKFLLASMAVLASATIGVHGVSADELSDAKAEAISAISALTNLPQDRKDAYIRNISRDTITNVNYVRNLIKVATEEDFDSPAVVKPEVNEEEYKPTEPVDLTSTTKDTYYLVIEGITTSGETTYRALSAADAEAYFRNYANDNGVTSNTVWSFDESTNTFTVKELNTAPDDAEIISDLDPEVIEEGTGEEYIEDDTVTEVGVVEDNYPEVIEKDLTEADKPELSLFRLNVKTSDTTIYTEFKAVDAMTAEMYFRNYVNENGLGDLEWTFDESVNLFIATEKGPDSEWVDELDPTKPDTPDSDWVDPFDGKVIEKDLTPKEGSKDPVVVPAKPDQKVVEKDVTPKSDSTTTADDKKAVADKATESKAATETKKEKVLPTTGDSTHPFFTVAALAVIAGAGMMVVSSKRKEN